jgi:hypothetical protein
MAGDVIRAYKRIPDVDCEAELETLGYEAAYKFLLFLGDVASGRREGQFLGEHRGIPIFRKTYRRNFVVYAIEKHDGECFVMIMLAGRAEPATIDGIAWDGSDLVALRSAIIDARMADCFR